MVATFGPPIRKDHLVLKDKNIKNAATIACYASKTQMKMRVAQRLEVLRTKNSYVLKHELQVKSTKEVPLA